MEAVWRREEVKTISVLGTVEPSNYYSARLSLNALPNELRIAVIGAGLSTEYSTLSQNLVEVVNFPDEQDHDYDGTTTNCFESFMRTLGVQSFSLISVKAVGEKGGTSSNLCQALLTCDERNVDIIFVPLTLDRTDLHVLGVVRQVSNRRAIVTGPTPAGRGTCFPGMVESLVLQPDHPDLPTMRQFAVYAHPSDYPEGFVVREWYFLDGALGPGRAWSFPTLEAVHQSLPSGMTMVAGRDPSNPVIVEVWL